MFVFDPLTRQVVYHKPRHLFLKDHPEFPFYTTSTPEAAHTQWPLNQIRILPLLPSEWIPSFSFEDLVRADQIRKRDNEKPMSFADARIVIQAGFVPFDPLPASNYRGMGIEAFTMEPPLPATTEELEFEDFIALRIEKIESNRSITSLERLIEDLWELAKLRRQRNRFMIGVIMQTPFPRDMECIEKRIAALLPAAYLEPVQPSLEGEILGYTIPEFYTTFALAHNSYLQLRREWEREDQLSREDLRTWLEQHCCSDWGRIDAYGDSYMGFWEYPEDTHEYKNAYALTRKANLDALWTLPYPSAAIAWTIGIGCGNREECIMYTILCCEWFQRKWEQMKDIPVSSYMFDDEAGDDEKP